MSAPVTPDSGALQEIVWARELSPRSLGPSFYPHLLTPVRFGDTNVNVNTSDFFFFFNFTEESNPFAENLFRF